MSYTRPFYVALSLAIGGYLCKSATYKNINTISKCNPSTKPAGHICKQKWWDNFFKVNAQPDEHGDDDPDEKDFGESVTVAHVMPLVRKNGVTNVKSPHVAYEAPDENIPTRSTVVYRDYIVIVDSRTRTPVWCIQRITRRNWAITEHRHCEVVTFQCNMPDGGEIGREENVDRVELSSLLAQRIYEVYGEVYCYACEKSKFWKRFHEYISHLLEMYDEVSVCSGVLRLDDRGLANPSHVFKVICCKNPDEPNYRFECYKIPTDPMYRVPKLKDHLMSREELEAKTGFRVFEHVQNWQMKQTETHPGFV